MEALHGGEYTLISGDGEAPPPTGVDRRRGGWAATPFIIATVFGMMLAGGGWSSNLIVFLINEFHIKSIDAAQISNVVAGCTNFLPLVGAVVADSLLGCFSVIWISSLMSLLGLILFVLSEAIEGLKPSNSPSGTQYAVLYSAISLATIGAGGTRYTLATMGANQFAGPIKHHLPTFFNWPLNRAALKTEGDILPNGSIATPWKLCSVKQVEDLKSLIKILPLWSSGIFLATPIGIQLSLTVLQALAADRRLGRSFEFSAGFIPVFSFIATAVGLPLIDHCFRPVWKKLTAGRNPTPLQQIGIGHVINIASMAVSALVESRRRSSAVTRTRHLMSVMWLVPQMVVAGIGEAFHFPGHVGLYYQEFPTCLKSLSTAMVALLLGVAFYLSTAVVDLIRRVTDWLPDDINYGRVDNVYWVMVVIGIINFAYFLLISWTYKYKNVQVVNKDQIVFGDDEA